MKVAEELICHITILCGCKSHTAKVQKKDHILLLLCYFVGSSFAMYRICLIIYLPLSRQI